MEVSTRRGAQAVLYALIEKEADLIDKMIDTNCDANAILAEANIVLTLSRAAGAIDD